MLQKITNLTTNKYISVSACGVDTYYSTFIAGNYLYNVDADQVILLKLTFNNLDDKDFVQQCHIKLNINTSKYDRVNFMVKATTFDGKLTSSNSSRLIDIANGYSIYPTVSGGIFVRDTTTAGFQEFILDITNALKTISKNQNSILLMIGNDVSNLSNSDMTINTPAYLSFQQTTCSCIIARREGFSSAFTYNDYENAGVISKVNVATGGLLTIVPLFKTHSNKIPISLTMCINEGKEGYGTIIGNNFARMDYIYELDFVDDRAYLLDYTGGTKEFIKVDTSVNGFSLEKEGINNYYNHSYTSIYKCLYDGSYFFFDGTYCHMYTKTLDYTKLLIGTNFVKCLEKRNIDGNYLTYTWDSYSGKLTRIQNNDGDSITLNYVNEKLTSISTLDTERRVFLAYEENKLTITEKGFSDGNNNLSTMKVTNNVEITFSNNGVSYIHDLLTGKEIVFHKSSAKVVQVDVKVGNIYQLKNVYSYLDGYNQITDYKGNYLNYFYDSAGRIKLIVDNYGNAKKFYHNGEYDGVLKDTNTPNIIRHSRNFLRDGKFDKLINWSFANFATSTYFIDRDGIDGKCLGIDKKINENISISQDINCLEKGTYKLKGLLKCELKTNVSVNITFSGSYYLNNTLHTFSKTLSNFMLNGNWESFELEEVIIPFSSTNITGKVTIQCSGGEVKINFANFMLSNPKYVNINMVENGYMDFVNPNFNALENWTTDNCLIERVLDSGSDIHLNLLGNYVMKIRSNDTTTKRVYTTLNIKGASNERFILTAYGKCDFNMYPFKIYAKFTYKNSGVRTYEAYFDTTTNNWDIANTFIVTEDSFTSVEVGVESSAPKDMLVDAIQLVKTSSVGADLSYNSNLSQAKNTVTSAQYVYDDLNRLIKVYGADGLVTKYGYQGHKVSKVEDSIGNSVIYSYTNGLVTSITTKFNNVSDVDQFSYDESGNPITTRVESLNSTNTYDGINRLLTSKLGNDSTYSYAYTEFDELKSVNVSSPSTIVNTLTYLDNKNVSCITNGSKRYEFTYDSFGRVLSITQDDSLITTFTYQTKVVSNFIYASNLYQSTRSNGDVLTYLYNDEDNLVEIKLNNKTLITYKYDGANRIIETKKYEYDSSNNYLTTYTNKCLYMDDGRVEFLSPKSSVEDIIENGVLRKKIYHFDDTSRAVDYIYPCDYYEQDTEGYVGRLIQLFNEEIMLPENAFEGVFGSRPYSYFATNINTDTTSNIKYFRASTSRDYVYFDLDQIGRTEEWKERFEKYKVFSVWIKPLANFASTNVFSFYRGTRTNKTKVGSLDINHQGSLVYTSVLNGSTITFGSTLEYNKWNLVTFKMFNLDSTYTKIGCAVGGFTSSNYSVFEDVEDVSILGLCVCENSDVVMVEESSSSSSEELLDFNDQISTLATIATTDLVMPLGVWALGIASREYNAQELSRISITGNELLNSVATIKNQYAGTIYYNKDLYGEFEVASLNGNLLTSKGRKPCDYVEFDTSYKNPMLRSFVLDQERFVYGSYSSYARTTLTYNKQTLGYDFNIGNNGRFILRFKLDSSAKLTDTNRTLISFGNGTTDTFRIDVTSDNILLSQGQTVRKTVSKTLTQDIWHFLYIDYSTNVIRVLIDGEIIDASILTNISLKGLITYIGVSKANNTWLNGKFQMLGFASGSLESVEINQLQSAFLFNDGMPYIRLNKIGKKGNVIGKIYITPNYNVDESVAYFSNTSRVSSEEFSNGLVNTLRYDTQGRISYYDDEDLECEYIYDSIGRLLEEHYLNDETIKSYTYDSIGNIISKTLKNHDIIVDTYSYNYHSVNKDKLLSIKDKNNQVITSIEYGVNNVLDKPTKINNDILVWEGNTLKKYGNVEFYYNSQGIRYKKVDKSGTTPITTEYQLDGDKIIRLTKQGKVFDFVYDTFNRVIGFNYNYNEYFYERDAVGNIISIIDKNGRIMVKYGYDAYGNIVYTALGTENDAQTILNYNPFIWKGYCYDVETGLAMVGQRYYSPELCRFIQPADVASLNPRSINGLNLYAYANNNPIGIAYSSSRVSGIVNGGMVSSVALGGIIISNIGTINHSFIWPNLDFLGTGFGYIENSFSMIAGVIDGIRNIKHLDKLAGLDKASNWLMGIGIGINVGLSIYNNLTNSNLSGYQKAGNIFGDIVYIAASSAATWGVSALTAMIPVVGPFLAPIVGFGFGTALDQFWHGEDIFGIEGFSFNPGGKSIDEWIKEFLTELFGG